MDASRCLHHRRKSDRFGERPQKVKFVTSATLGSLLERGLLRSLDSDGGTQGAARYHHGR